NDLGEYRLFWLQPGQYFVSATAQDGQRGALVNALAVAGPGIAGSIADVIANRGGGAGRGGAGRGNAGAGQRGASPQPAQAPSQAPPPANDEQPGEGYVPVYYPGTTDAQSAAPINLPPGIVFSGVDLTVATVRTLRVQGQVVNDVTGQPAQNANIMLVPVQRTGGAFRGGVRNGNFRSRINNQGAFGIRGIIPGSYELVAVINDRQNRMSARLPIEVGNSDIQNVSLIAMPGYTLTGRVSIDGQAGATGDQSLTRIRVNLRPTSVAQVAGAPPASSVQTDGT